MKRRAIRAVFVDGALRQEGEVFEASRPWKYTEPDGGDVPAEDPPKIPAVTDRKELMAELAGAGVKYKSNASSAELAKLLAAAKQQIAPAAADTPAGNGVGDQDVI